MEILRNVIESIRSCCMSCLSCSEEDTRPGEPTERSHLLSHQQNQISPIRRISEVEDEYPSSLPTREMKDEQTALNRIVQETNSNIIDVSALDTHLLEQSEYNNRVKLYSQRLAQQWNSIPVPDVKYNGLLKDVPNPEILLAFTPSPTDIEMAKNFVKEAAQAINDMRVDNHEDLVVPFQIT